MRLFHLMHGKLEHIIHNDVSNHTLVYQMRFDEYSISVCYGMNEPQIKCQLTACTQWKAGEKKRSQYDKWHTICNKSLLVQPERTKNYCRNSSQHFYVQFHIKFALARRISYSNCCREVFYSRLIRAKLYMNAKNENQYQIGSENAHA